MMAVRVGPLTIFLTASVAVILRVDCHVASLKGLPRILPQPDAHIAGLPKVAAAFQGTAPSWGTPSDVRPEDRRWMSLGLKSR